MARKEDWEMTFLKELMLGVTVAVVFYVYLDRWRTAPCQLPPTERRPACLKQIEDYQSERRVREFEEWTNDRGRR